MAQFSRDEGATERQRLSKSSRRVQKTSKGQEEVDRKRRKVLREPKENHQMSTGEPWRKSPKTIKEDLPMLERSSMITSNITSRPMQKEA